jgi:hypothetical protein
MLAPVLAKAFASSCQAASELGLPLLATDSLSIIVCQSFAYSLLVKVFSLLKKVPVLYKFFQYTENFLIRWPRTGYGIA